MALVVLLMPFAPLIVGAFGVFLLLGFAILGETYAKKLRATVSVELLRSNDRDPAIKERIDKALGGARRVEEIVRWGFVGVSAGGSLGVLLLATLGVLQ